MSKSKQIVPTRTILSSEAKANFAQLVDDVYAHGTRYVIQRFDTPRAVLIPLADWQRLLMLDQADSAFIREQRTPYQLGQECSLDEIAMLIGATEKKA